MYTYLQQALPRVVTHRTQVVEEKWKLRVWFSPTKENRVHQTKISTNTDSFSPAVFRSRLEQKISATKCLVCCVFVLFSMAESIVRMGSYVRFCCYNILSLHTICGEGSPWSVLKSLVAVEKFPY